MTNLYIPTYIKEGILFSCHIDVSKKDLVFRHYLTKDGWSRGYHDRALLSANEIDFLFNKNLPNVPEVPEWSYQQEKEAQDYFHKMQEECFGDQKELLETLDAHVGPLCMS